MVRRHHVAQTAEERALATLTTTLALEVEHALRLHDDGLMDTTSLADVGADAARRAVALARACGLNDVAVACECYAKYLEGVLRLAQDLSLPRM